MSSVAYRVTRALVTSPVTVSLRYVEALREFYRIADQVNIRSASFAAVSNSELALKLDQMVAELTAATAEVGFEPGGLKGTWSKRLLTNLSYERNGLEQHEVKMALMNLAHEAAQLSWVIETEVGRNNWVRKLDDVEELTRQVYGEPKLSRERAVKVRDYIVELIEDCADILEEAGSSVDELTPFKDDFTKACDQEYGEKSVAVR